MADYRKRDPKTKGEVVDRLLSFDFEGDIRQIGAEPARLERTGAQSFRVTFPASDRTYEFVVRIPRDEEKLETRRAGQGDNRTSEERSFSPAPGSPEAGADADQQPAAERPKRTYQRRVKPNQPGAQQ